MLDLLPMICEPGSNRCDVVDETNNFLYCDSSHWTLEGARYFGAKLHAHRFWESRNGEFRSPEVQQADAAMDRRRQ